MGFVERGPWEEIGRCADCNYLAKRTPDGHFFCLYRADVCPRCGGRHTGKVIARHVRTVRYEPRWWWLPLRTDYLAAVELTGGTP
jgi:hypothetical protein